MLNPIPLSEGDLLSEEESDSSNDSLSLDESSISSMAKTTTKKAGSTKSSQKAELKTTGLDSTPPTKKVKIADPPKPYNINVVQPWTTQQYAVGSHNIIDLVLHVAGVPSRSAQPEVLLSSDGMNVSVGWKTPIELLSDKQAMAQKISPLSGRFQAYNDTMQAMNRDGIRNTGKYYIGDPQIVELLAKCVEVIEIERLVYPVGTYNKQQQYNSIYVVKLRVDNVRVGLAGHVKEGGEISFGFLSSQESAGSGKYGGGGMEGVVV